MLFCHLSVKANNKNDFCPLIMYSPSLSNRNDMSVPKTNIIYNNKITMHDLKIVDPYSVFLLITDYRLIYYKEVNRLCCIWRSHLPLQHIDMSAVTR